MIDSITKLMRSRRIPREGWKQGNIILNMGKKRTQEPGTKKGNIKGIPVFLGNQGTSQAKVREPFPGNMQLRVRQVNIGKIKMGNYYMKQDHIHIQIILGWPKNWKLSPLTLLPWAPPTMIKNGTCQQIISLIGTVKNLTIMWTIWSSIIPARVILSAIPKRPMRFVQPHFPILIRSRSRMESPATSLVKSAYII